jgi:PAS domain S-box-containing protein
MIVSRFIIILFLFYNILFAKQMQEVSLQLLWQHQFEFAGFYMAKEKGYYKDLGLDVKIKEFNFGDDITKDVESGKTTFGINYPSVILDKMNGSNIVLLNAIFQSSPHVLVSLKSSGIKSIKDFKNKKIKFHTNQMRVASISSMLYSQGIKYDDLQKVKYSYDINELIDKKVDLVATFLSSKEIYTLINKNIKFNIWNPKDYGFDFYDDILFTSKKVVDTNPKLVKDFQDASIKGWRYAFDHIDETINLIQQKYNTQNISKEVLRYEAKILKELAYKDNIPLGNIDKNKILRISDIYNLIGFSNNKIELKDFIFKKDNNINLTLKEKKWISNNIVQVGGSPWYPITYVDKKTNEIEGVGIDILNLVVKKTGLKIQYVPDHWSVLLNDFKKHKIDLLPTTYYTKDRSKFGDYTTSYMSIKEYLYVKDDSEIKNFNDLKNKKIAMVKSHGTIDKIKQKYPNIKIIEVKTLEQTIKMLLNDEVDAIFNTQFSIDSFLKTSFISGLKPIYQTDFKPSTLHYFTNKNKPILNTILQKAIDSIDDKNKDKIINYWINNLDKTKSSLKYLTKNEKKYIKNNKIIKMCNNPNWRPIEFAKDGDMNKMQGIAIDTLKIIEEKLNIKFVNVPTKNWTQSQQFLKEKKCDILPCAIKTKKREQFANFTKPYLSYKLAIITKNDKPFINSLDEISNKSVARKKGSGLIAKLKNKYPNINIIETNDYLESLQKVSKGEVYCTIATLPVASYYINRFALNNLQVAGYTIMKYNLSIAIRDDDPILLSILDKSLDNIPSNIKKDIYNKWVTSTSINNSIIDYKTSIYILLVIAIVILLLLYKQTILKKSLKDFNELIDATMEGILLFKNGECVDVNKSALDIFGYKTKDEMIGKKALEFVSDKSKDLLKENIKKDDAKAYEAIMLKKDGTEFYGLLRGYNLKSKKVRLSSIIDISNLKKQEKLIAEQAKLASMGEMIGNIAHQWRQPLSVISTAATGMKMQKEFNLLSDEMFENNCEIINKNAQYLSKTIDDFRNFIKGDRVKSYFNVKNQLDSFRNLIDGSIKNYDINLIIDVDDNIEINGYENELTQCLINIFNNAKDALVENIKDNRLILISIDISKDSLVIKIQDNAKGIDEQILPNIFEPYFTTKHKSQGTGLGLNMTYKLIVEGMGGEIKAVNKKFIYNGKEYFGALFIIKIPLK